PPTRRATRTPTSAEASTTIATAKQSPRPRKSAPATGIRERATAMRARRDGAVAFPRAGNRETTWNARPREPPRANGAAAKPVAGCKAVDEGRRNPSERQDTDSRYRLWPVLD